MHQKWKQEQELRRRKAAELDSNSTSGGQKGGKEKEGDYGEPTTNITGAVKVAVKLFRWTIMSIAIVMAAGFFVAGDPLWGYRGKYTRLRTYMPVSTSTQLLILRKSGQS